MRIPLLMKDLTDPTQQGEVLEELKSTAYSHMAPPCGTASLARNQRVSKEDKARGAPEPKPLRDANHPWGLPGLGSFDQMKVDKANAVYKFCITVIHWCCSQTPAAPFTLENPSRSWIWKLPPMIEVMERFKLSLLHMDMCMHGSKRKKQTGILTNYPEMFSPLVTTCDGNHSHEAWGPIQDPITGKWSFATEEECEYPPLFCDRIAECVAKHFDSLPREAPKIKNKRNKAPQSRLRTRAEVGHQSKRLTTMCFIPERKQPRKIYWHAHEPYDFPMGKLKETLTLGKTTLPKGDYISEAGFEKNGNGNGYTLTATIEEQRTPTEFIEASLGLQVPWQGQPCIPDRTLKTMVEILEQGVSQTSKKWDAVLDRLEQRTKSFQEREVEVRRNLHPSVQRVTQGKETTAMKEFLQETRYPDPNIADEIREGFRIVGDFEHCPIYDTKPEDEIMSAADPEWLEIKAKEIRKDLEAMHKRCREDEITDQAWFITDGNENPTSETALGWASGPSPQKKCPKESAPRTGQQPTGLECNRTTRSVR